MKKIKRSKLIKFMSLTLAVVIVTGSVIGYNKFKANAENDINTQSEIENTEIIENYEVEAEASNSLDMESMVQSANNGLETIEGGTEADAESNQYVETLTRASQKQDNYFSGRPGEYIRSNTWRDTSATKSGNTYQWKYQVSAEANTSATVQRIRTTWVISATICKGATLDIGVKSDGKVSVGSSSSWKNVKSKPKYWENTKGQKSASYKSNFVITPCSGYKTGSRAVTNTALLQVYGDARTFEITSGV